jgi:hypothetical protein
MIHELADYLRFRWRHCRQRGLSEWRTRPIHHGARRAYDTRKLLQALHGQALQRGDGCDRDMAWPPGASHPRPRPDRLAVCLDVLQLHNDFAGSSARRPLLGANRIPTSSFMLRSVCDAKPADCIIIEDSASGVTAGIAAGMTVIGLMAASHMRPEHRQGLVSAGAHFIAATFKDAADITRRLIRSPGALPLSARQFDGRLPPGTAIHGYAGALSVSLNSNHLYASCTAARGGRCLLPKHTNSNEQGTSSEEQKPDDSCDLCNNVADRKACHHFSLAEMGLLRPHFVDARTQLFRHSGSLTPPQQRPSGSEDRANCSVL